ncbi:SdpI family protein [Cohnella soli]|uniref:SdpI family protein n=1 Tax=Cohnella soli TaxID=425005 RepID=A0ABW0HKH6_9BACL
MSNYANHPNNSNLSNETPKPVWSTQDWILIGANALIFMAMFLIFNHQLPEQVASHYNINGDQDRMMAKWSFWLMYGLIGVLLPAIISVSRLIDPRKNNYTRFQGYFDLMRWAISLFLQAIFLIVILDNTGHKLPALNLVMGGIGVLLIVIGNRMGQLRSNFFVGIRTPWALMDEDNWRKTHRLGARMWVLCGLILFIAAWFAPAPWLAGIVIAAVAVCAGIPTLYSYLLFRGKSAS